MMFSFFIVQETLYLYDKKRSARMHMRTAPQCAKDGLRHIIGAKEAFFHF